MKDYCLILLVALLTPLFPANAQQADWKIVEGKIITPWAEEVDPENPLPEYPRPQMVRENWQNLNGLWEYAIKPANEDQQNGDFDGHILVPYPVESALSGVGRRVGQDNILLYKRDFKVSKKRNEKVLLHFGAVDWRCEVYINGEKAGTHEGGYDPFSFDITEHLNGKRAQELVVKVWDPTDGGPQPRGKQIKNPHGIWYTPVTGIWQTVWIESVPETFIASTRQTPDIDAKVLTMTVQVENAKANDQIRVSAWDGKQQVASQEAKVDAELTLQIENPKLWSPDEPFLYDLKVAVVRNGKVVDEVESYFAMRKISMEPDENGVQRMLLNNEFVFQYGPLDQGWWPDGLYTAPTDEALLFDIEKTKAMGFNMIRKHVKVEPARWYYHCDKLGMLVWQDMPNGDHGNTWEPRPGVTGKETEKDRTEESKAIFKKEWTEIMNDFHNFPSIVVWVPFNEAWGQFNTEEVTKQTMKRDPSRLVNSASGGNFHPVGHIIDLHNYPEPVMPKPELFGADRVIVLGEFGGLGLPVDGHTWQQKDNWGYQSFKNADELFERYVSFTDRLVKLIERGLSAAIYTQTTDVEVETNGLMTYDRKVIKIPVEQLKDVHKKLYE